MTSAVQVLTVLLEEFLVVFLRNVIILLVELRLKAILRGGYVAFPAARGSE